MLRSAIVLALALPPALAGEVRTVTFTKESEGKLPPGWTATHTGKTTEENSIWKVVADKTAPASKGFVLAQFARSPKAIFNLCVFEESKLRDLEIEVAFKAVKGEIDQGGGLVWRYQDAGNYYLCRMNPLENNFRLYKVVAGVRKQLKTVEDLNIRPSTWNVIKVQQIGKRMTCYLNGTKLLEDADEEFPAAGRIGLWTKADAQTYFDAVRYRELSNKGEE